jgi:hypothetical protein
MIISIVDVTQRKQSCKTVKVIRFSLFSQSNKKLHSVTRGYSQCTTEYFYKLNHRVTLCEHCGTLCNCHSYSQCTHNGG